MKMAMNLEAFVTTFSDLLAKLVKDEVTLLLGVDKEIKKLQITLEAISSVLEDAERRRIDSSSIDRWLRKLKDVMYDADDILDLCTTEAENYSISKNQEQSITSRGRKALSCCNFPWQLSCLPLPTFSCNPVFAHKIGNIIKHLNQKLEEISKEKDRYGLFQLRHYDLRDEGRVTQISDKTSSVVESDLVGSKIIEDTRKMVGLLSREENINDNILVFAIVGMGVIGKTTLAQMIFNDETINNHFQLKIWVSVSKKFDENDLLRDVINSANGDLSGANSMSQLQTKLVDTVKGKKVMLVLDDVWDESVWDMLLRNPLNRCALGSRILVTTRTEWVAKQMKAVYCQQINVLSLED